ncbi:MAG: hypothetical protein ACKODX_05345, partial [Gemmata sp.]
MTFARSAAWILLAGAGFALFAGPARAQPAALPKQDNTAFTKVREYRDIGRGGIPKDELKAAQGHFAKFASYFAEVLKHPLVYRAPQEFKPLPPEQRHMTIEGEFGVLKVLEPYILEPGVGAKAGADGAVYVRELGAAFDAALRALIENDPEPIVKVNAARVLAYVCRGGSPAHYATLTELLGNANTRTEIKYYLFHAAANLLAASDPNWLKTRNHVAQTDNPKVVGALVKVLDDCVTNPALLVPGLPGNKADQATPDQLTVVALVRRQAVKALAQYRFAAAADADGKPLYPAHTLVRVAMSDPALLPAPGPADAAEAVIGICNMAPVEAKGDKTVPVKYNADVAVEAVTAALVTFAEPRAADPFDRRLPWRTYSLRIAEALRNWRPLF